MTTTIYLFRNDLRLTDLPGLAAAAANGPVLPVYVLDDDSSGERAPGGASRWWLHHSLLSLAANIEAAGGQLLLRRGDTVSCLREMAQAIGATAIYFSRSYSPWERALEQRLHQEFDATISVKRFPGTLLHEPEKIANQAGEPFKVFTPFWRHCKRQEGPGLPLRTPSSIAWAELPGHSDTLADWGLLPEQPDWAAHWPALWSPGAGGAQRALDQFLRHAVANYASGRDHPAEEATSRLSPHLRFGEISPREVWHKAQELAANNPEQREQVDKFLSELGWREFSYHLLYHFPSIPEQPFKAQFADFPWLGSEAQLRAWQRGQTGYPVVDAGMRELWHTGYMHNRIRMVTASFLTKHLLTHWRTGERWFWDTLVDADPASNTCSWQWVAGSGADAAPYFRIFNPVTQGEKFDAGGDYVRRWVPEIAALPDRYLHRPWEAPADILAKAGIILGQDYPLPVVDHRAARESALAAYQHIRSA
jgi:deoxyribodipyrimidine photo-lyase